jgi:heterotetrameric sarcosine oxidase delta subunit
MLLIPCPWCGPRGHAEFSYGGDAAMRQDAALTDAAFLERVYLRDNPRGLTRELWQHNAGCRRWIVVERDTLTHEIKGASPP